MRGYVELLTQKGIAAMVDCQNGGRAERYDGKSVSFFMIICHAINVPKMEGVCRNLQKSQ